MINVVGAEAHPDKLLEQIGFFIGALGRAQTGQSLGAVFVADTSKPGSRDLERLLPACLAEMGRRVTRIEARQIVLADAVLANQRLGQTVRMVDIVEPEPAFDTQPTVIGRAVAPFDLQ